MRCVVYLAFDGIDAAPRVAHVIADGIGVVCPVPSLDRLFGFGLRLDVGSPVSESGIVLVGDDAVIDAIRAWLAECALRPGER